MTRHLAKLFDAIWYICMGLFLGLTGGIVLSVILTFRGAREIDATPGVEQYGDPMFAEYHNDAVAGYIGQNIFTYGFLAAILLLNLAVFVWFIKSFITAKHRGTVVGSKPLGWIRDIALLACVILMVCAISVSSVMNDRWESLYDLDAGQALLDEQRTEFDQLHQTSGRLMTLAWLSGFITLLISPWCRRIADAPLQSSDGKDDRQEENRETQEA